MELEHVPGAASAQFVPAGGLGARCPAEVEVDVGDSGHGDGAGLGAGCPLGALTVLGSDPTGLGTDGLGDFLGAVRAVRSWVDAREAAALAVAARSDAAREAGAADTAAWLAQNTGVERREALARARTAAGLEDLPLVGEALHGGHITHGHARALTPYARPAGVDLDVDSEVDFPDPARDAARRVAAAVRAGQETLIAAAESMSIDAYRRFLRRWADMAAEDDGAGRDIAQRRRRSVTTFETGDGMRGVRGLLPADQFAFFENELRRLAEARWRADHPDADNVPAKELTCPQRNADALVDMARRSRQLGDNNDEPLGSHINVMVLIDHETLTEGTHAGSRCEFDDTTPLSPATARRLMCDADVITAMTHRHSWKLDLGYSRRSADRKIRQALIARDRTCTAPGCERPHWMCEIHHIVPWSEGGRTDLDNLTLLCSRHHHLLHANESRRTKRARTTDCRGHPPRGQRGDPSSEQRCDPPSDRPRDPGRSASNSRCQPEPASRNDRVPNRADRPPPPGQVPKTPMDPVVEGRQVSGNSHSATRRPYLPPVGAAEGC